MTDTSGSRAGGDYRQGRRARQPVPRTHRIEFTLTDEEYAAMTAAARQAGLARAAYAAKTLMAAADRDSGAGDQELYRQMLTELMRAGGLVRRIGVNLTQAAATLTKTGQSAGDLPAYAAWTTGRADHIDEVADVVRKALR